MLFRSYDSFISSIGTIIPSSSDIIGRLLAEHARRKDRVGADTALVATGGKRPTKAKKQKKFRRGVFCHGCNKEGHIKPECDDPAVKREVEAAKRARASARAHVATEADGHGGNSDEDYSFVVHNEDCQSLVAKTGGAEVWLGDTGSQRHIVRDRTLFTTYTEGPSEIKGIGTASAAGRGNVRVDFSLNGKSVPITLRDALHVPTLDYNLISLGRLTGAGLSYTGKDDHLTIYKGDRAIGKGRKSGNLYHMAVKRPHTVALAAHTTRTWYDWHCALGHLGKRHLFQLPSMVEGMAVDENSDRDFECEACIQAKHARAPYPDITADRN